MLSIGNISVMSKNSTREVPVLYINSNTNEVLKLLNSFRDLIDIVSKLLEQVNYPLEEQNDVIITIWAFIHGITSLATMSNVYYNNDWKQKVIDFMEIFELSFLNNMGEKV